MAITRTSKPVAIEQIAERHDQPARQQQHVEQQRADGGNAEDAERGAAGLADEASRRESERVHRRVSRNISRRSSVHDEASVASDAERHGDIAIDRSAIRGVMRTKTSEVS